MLEVTLSVMQSMVNSKDKGEREMSKMKVSSEEMSELKKLLACVNDQNTNVDVQLGESINCGHCSGLCLGTCSNYCVDGCKNVCDGSGNACNKSHYR